MLLLSLLLSMASAQETVDIGVLKDSDVQVVQKLLYPKAGRTEFGVHVGYMPFDFATKTPNAQISFQMHSTDSVSVGAWIGAGWGFKSRHYKELEGPTYGVAYNAYRYLGSALVGAEWAPIYGKSSLSYKKVVHHDVYFSGRGGLTVESSLLPSGGTSRLALGPTASVGAGMRFWLSRGSALKFELRDDVQLQRRALTEDWAIKQNVNLTVGYTILGGGS
ncbi:MAG: outer membrane beta-barrel domain-containing protein [Deltaproteobacteria bacterium]|nr:MAG: outer membrane beta-barrel domain-containing protein [Deltaproteobacteria bacterium]